MSEHEINLSYIWRILDDIEKLGVSEKTKNEILLISTQQASTSVALTKTLKI